jgi:hypothetical protein
MDRLLEHCYLPITRRALRDQPLSPPGFVHAIENPWKGGIWTKTPVVVLREHGLPHLQVRLLRGAGAGCCRPAFRAGATFGHATLPTVPAARNACRQWPRGGGRGLSIAFVGCKHPTNRMALPNVTI